MANLLEMRPEYVLPWMVVRGAERRGPAGENIVRGGSPAPSMFLVLDSLFSVLSSTQNGHPAATVAPGGRVILGNFHPLNPAREVMDSVLEWNLIHRTEDDMHALFRASPFSTGCSRLLVEQEGIDLVAECVKQ